MTPTTGAASHDWRSLVDVARWRARSPRQPAAYTFLLDGEREGPGLTFAQLDGQARRIAAWLQDRGLEGERVLLLFPAGLDFVCAFLGCLYAGAIAVPAYPPRGQRREQRLPAIWRDARPRLALTVASLCGAITAQASQQGEGRSLVALPIDSAELPEADEWKETSPGGDAPAFLQYTSGSTASPKGVLVTHAALLHNQRMIREAFGQTEDSVVLGWLPLYHDMGLIGNVLQPLYVGARCILMSPTAFLQRPRRWLEAIGRYGATTSGGPNFAYELCVRRASAPLADLDLSSWTVAFNGAEPVRADTLTRFADAFAGCGFRRQAFYPCYGLAEATLFVTGGSIGEPPVCRTFEAAALADDHGIVDDGAAARMLTGCGRPWLGQRLAIVDPATGEERPPGRVGEIWVAGPSVAAGYWRMPGETEHTFQARLAGTGEGPFLRTGDLGFVHDSELFVTGRLKDLIILRGRNHYPQDIELSVENSHPAIRPGGVTAFSVEAAGEERLLVACELERRRAVDFAEVAQALRGAVAEDHEIQVFEVLFLPPGATPKTSSGKLQRQALRAGYVAGAINILARATSGRLAPAAAAGPEPTRESLLAVAADERQPVLLAWLRGEIARLVGIEVAAVDPALPLACHGLDSLRVVELAHGIERCLGVTTTPAELLGGPSAGDLADHLAAGVAAAPRSVRRPREGAEESLVAHPLSEGQRGLWFLHQLEGDSGAYHLVAWARVLSGLDPAALRGALQALVDRHPMLRTSFGARAGVPWQRPAQTVEVDFAPLAVPAAAPDALAQAVAAEAYRPFDLERDRLLRVRLAVLPDGSWALLWVVHHIVADFISLAILARELGALYDELTGGPAADLPAPATTYAAHVAAQNALLESTEGERLWAFWRERVGERPPVLQLPTDRRRPELPSYSGSSHSRQVAAEVRGAVEAVCYEISATSFAALLAAWDALLARYAVQDEFFVGYAASGRGAAPDLADVVGYFINPLSHRAQLAAVPSFAQLVRRVHDDLLAGLAHQQLPLPRLVERLQLEREPNRTPVFQTMLVFLPDTHAGLAGLAPFALGEPGAQLTTGGLQLESLPLPERRTPFELLLTAAGSNGGWRLSLQYQAALFDAATAAALLQHFIALLRGGAERPGQSVAALPLLDDSECLQVVRLGAGPVRAYQGLGLLHALVAAQVERTPDAVAIDDGRVQLTYAELDRRSARLARHLRHLGVGPEVRAAVCLDRRPELVIALLAVLRAGGAYVPLDPHYPAARLSFMLADSGAAVVLSDDSLAPSLPPGAARIVRIDDVLGRDGDDRGASDGNPQPANLAYVIYTSGSTGRPKGVAIEHRSAAALVRWALDVFAARELAATLASTSICFDLSVFELFVPLAQGGRIVLVRDALALPAVGGEVTCVNTVPSAAAELIRGPGLPPSVRVVNLAGEPLKATLAQEIYARSAVTSVLNLYGPSEDTTYSTWARVPRAADGAPAIGRPIANTQAYVCDARGALAPRGVIGELYLGGDGLARGYLDRRELTAERFVPDGFSGRAGARLYRTGDLVRWRRDGELEFLGRLDHQVKIRGHRIELGEIESTLLRHPAVRDAVVVVWERATGVPQLVAYVEAAGTPPSPGELHAFLRPLLPAFMLPASFIALPALPRTPSGKVNRAALPASGPERPEVDTPFMPPRTATEETLAAIWCRVLGLDRVGVHDNFFALGGDSILVLQVVAQARSAGLSIAPQEVFRHQSVATLAAVARAPALPARRSEATPGAVPFTPIQRWFFERWGETPHHFNQAVLLTADRPLRPPMLVAALAALLRCHSALRLRCRSAAAPPGWLQEIAPPDRFDELAVVDLSALPAAARRVARRQVAIAIQAGLDICRGPLLRAVLFVGAEPCTLLLVAHHLAVDGVSWRILLPDLDRAYRCLERGLAPDLPVAPISFADWAHGLAARARGAENSRFWLAELARPAARLPLDFPAGRNLVTAERTVVVALGQPATRRLLQDVPRLTGRPVHEALLASLAIALADWTGASTHLIDVEGHGRELEAGLDLSRTVGWFTSLFPVVLEVPPTARVQDALAAVRAALPRFSDRAADWGLGRYLADDPTSAVLHGLPDAAVCCNYLGRLDGALPVDAIFTAARPWREGTADPRAARPHLLAVNTYVLGGRLHLEWSYSRELHREATVRRLAALQREALLELCAAPRTAALPASTGLPTSGDAPLAAANEEPYPLASLQQGFLVHSLLAAGSGAYLQQLSCSLRGRLDEAAFVRAWQRLVDRHAILRTAFHWQDAQEPLQRAHSHARLPVAIVDWSALPRDAQQAQLANYLTADRRRGFDLARPPLLRLLLVRLGGDRHAFVLSYHHLLLDGWSLVLLLQELLVAYTALRDSAVVTSAPAPPYREFVEWLRRLDPSPAEAFWRQTLRGFTAPTPVGADRPGTPGLAEDHQDVRLLLSPELTARLAHRARCAWVTPSALVQAAWAVLLARSSGEEDVAFGVVLSGRSADLPDIDRRVGLFINTLPLRLSVPGQEPVLPWLRRVQACQGELLHFEHSSLFDVQRWSEVPAGQRLFETILAFENYPIPAALHSRPGDLTLDEVRLVERIDYPLALVATPGDRLALQFIYDRRMFDRTTMTRRLHHLEQLLVAITGDGELRVAELPLLAAAERHQLLREWNDTADRTSPDRLVHQLFEAQAARDPAALAVISPDEQLNYGELNRRANRLACLLRELGAGPSTVVGVHLHRGADMVTAVLGILKAGAAYVPLELGTPTARARWILSALGVRQLVTQTRCLERAAESATGTPVEHLVLLDAQGELPVSPLPRSRLWGAADLRRRAAADLPPLANPDDLAYVIFTSGSTGTPKGVMVRHRPVVNLIHWVNDTFGVGTRDRVLFITALGFDLSVYDIFGLLAAGGSIRVASEAEVRDPEQLARVLCRESLTYWDSAPAALQQLVPFLPAAGDTAPALRLVFLSGDWIPLTLPAEVRRTFPAAQVVALGGATEATVWSNVHRVGEVDPAWRSIPYGRPIRNARYHVLDAALQPAPIGVAGDLHIGGGCLASGYANEPALTAEKFVPDPFADRPGGHLYRTGDRARVGPDGVIEFLGRLDQQVKIRGFRIELGEIEAALAEHPDVRDAVVAARPDHAGEKRLVAYVVPCGEPAAAELRRHLAARLPEYMIPAVFVRLAALPLTANGKVDRRALPDPGAMEPEPAPAAAPANPLHDALAVLWAELLGRERVRPEENFFELGGDSLLATRLVVRLRELFQVELPVRAIFEFPTLAALAAELAARGRQDAAALLPPVVSVARGPRSPASFAQERLWFLDRLHPASSAYHIVAAFRLRGELAVGTLAAAVAEVVRRHEALRTRFEAGDAGVLQVVLPHQPLRLPLIDLSRVAPSRRDSLVRELGSEEADRPFDLATGPLLRLRLLRLAASDHLVLATMHHIVSDAWSMAIFSRETAVLYGAFATGEGSPLPPLPVQYADYAVWQRNCLRGETRESLLRYWRQRLAAAPPVLELPTDRPRPPVLTYRGAALPMVLPEALAARVRELARRQGTTAFVALLAAFQVLLLRITGREDIVVGAPVASRTSSAIEGLIGFFINSIVLRVDLQGNPPGGEAVARAREAALGAYVHQDLPFELLVDDLQPRRDLSHPPLFQALFQLQRIVIDYPRLPQLELTPVHLEERTAKLDLVLSLDETAQGMAGFWRFNTDLFDPTTVVRLRGQFTGLLDGLLADPARRVWELPLLSAPERQQIAVEWNDTGTAYHGPECLHQLIALQARRSPQRVAVECGDRRLTYLQLRRHSVQLARRLRALGCGPETRVGVAMERSLELVVALLAVLEAGAAYVPLDPDYPIERLRHMVEDASPEVVLTQRHLAHRLPEGLRGVLVVENDAAAEAPAGGAAEVVPAHPDQPAYVIYTSGSTGRPKGVVVTHRAIRNRLLWMQETYRLGAADRVLQKTPFSFDVSVWELFWPLLAGARLVMAKPGGHRDPAYLLQLIADRRVTVLHFVPPMLQVFLDQPGLERCTALRLVVCSGEALGVELQERCRARLGAPLHNLYGPTEAAVDVSFWPCRPERGRSLVPIGWPIANTRLHVLDPHLHPVALGAVGEICIGGVNLARGYLGQPALTAERFVPDPLGEEPGARLYRTGDLARRRQDGAIEFLGRRDHQVKVRGFRVELGEIEMALAAHPAVREAVVLMRRSGPEVGGERIVAYVVPAAPPLPWEQLRRALAERLPDYMLPAVCVELPALPLSPNGKVDRRALPEPPAATAGEAPTAAPCDALEAWLAARWQQVLGVPRVGIHDNFFALGGNSIQAAVLANRLQDEIGAIVHVVALFDAPTIAALAAYLRERYPAATARLAGAPAPAPARAAGRPLDAAKLAHARALLRPLPPPRTPLPEKNPPAVFILAPPRSGSTLLRVMLAGHPRLFAPPELELLSFDTLGARERALQGRNSLWLEGVIRAVMELDGCDAERAHGIVAEQVARDVSTRDFYRFLQQRIGDRLLVDKTSTYALDPQVLDRAEALFDQPFYIHLVRHPHAMIGSFVEARLEEIFFRYDHSFASDELAELIWVISHQNILQLQAKVPPCRWLTLRFEELVDDPRRVIADVCRLLDFDLDPAMLDPYEDRPGRMTNGLHRASRMIGDVKFHQHTRIDPAAAERWRDAPEPRELGDVTRELAAALGYAQEPAWLPLAPTAPDADGVSLSHAQQRLWFLEQLHPGTPLYHIIAALRIRGRLRPTLLARCLREVERRHEALRTNFRVAAHEPVQVVSGHRSSLLRVDLRALPAARREAEAWRLAAAVARGPFALESGPLWRAVLFEMGSDDWLLGLTMHHIVSDGWSVAVLVGEVTTLYAGWAQATSTRLPDLPVQYRDYSQWQRRWLAGGRLDAQLAYWKRQLADLPLLQLPTDRPRPLVQSHRGATRSVWLPPELVAELDGLAQSVGASLFMVLLAGLAAVLQRATGQSDFAVGSPAANRNRTEIEGLIGFFANTLALRCDLAGDPTFRELLARIRQTVLAAFRHQEVPFEKLVEELRPERDLSASPLFQVLLALQNAAPAPPEIPGLELEVVDLATGTAKFDLSLLAVERQRALLLVLEYAVALFDGTTIDRLGGHLRTLLAAAAAAPGERVALLPLLTSAERQQLLLEWSQGGPPAAETLCLHDLVAAQAERTPDQVAVVAGDENLTYQELERRAERLARRLRALGVGPEVPVGICTPRMPSLVVGILAALKAGGAYVPLDPAYPRERLDWILADARAPVVLTDGTSAAAPHAAGPVQVAVDGAGEEPPAASWQSPRPQNLAYVIYTSGSTGRPKGVAIEHRSAVAFLRWVQQQFSREELAGTLFSTSISFDLSVFELFAPLTTGGTVLLAQSAVELPRLPARDRVTLVNTVPSALHEILRLGGVPAAVRTVNLAGEPLPGALVEAIYRQTSVTRVFNLYGPSEATTYSTWARIDAGDAQPPAIGCPLPGTHAYLLDAALQPVPQGVVGELCLAGEGLARGYLGRPERTAERFVPDPFGHGARLYRTGDLCRHRRDGQLEFIGRRDHQVKIRGFRIELGEVEAALAALPGVREAVAAAREDAAGDLRLVGYVVPVADPPPTAAALRAALSARLPAFLVPSDFVILPALPLTPNGKVDRPALPPPRYEPTPTAAAASRAGSEPEQLLAQIWADVLGIGEVGLHEDFFDCGGHSLLATRVASRIRELFGVELPLRVLFQATTVAALTAEIERAAAAAAEGVAPPPPARGRRDCPLPLAFAQERLWFLEQLEPGTPAARIGVAVRLAGELDVGALRRAVAAVVRRHEALRTGFAIVDGQPVQLVATQVTLAINVADLRALPANRRHPELARLQRTLATLAFDLARPPLLRALLVRFEPSAHAFVVLLHHLIADGWSIDILVRELAALYNAGVAGAAPALPDVLLQEGDFALWQRDWLRGEELARQLAFWRRHLAGAPQRLELPTDRARSARRNDRGAVHVFHLAAELVRRLEAFGREAGATLFMTTLAAFAVVLCRLSGQTEVVIGANVANRHRRQLEGVIGCLANTVALRCDLAGEPTPHELLAQVRETVLAAMAHQDVPFEKVVEALKPERDPRYNPLFQVMFMLQHAPLDVQLHGLTMTQITLHAGASRADLALFLIRDGAAVRGVLEYDADLFLPATVQRIAEHYQNFLAALPRQVAEPVWTVAFADASAAAQIQAFGEELEAT